MAKFLNKWKNRVTTYKTKAEEIRAMIEDGADTIRDIRADVAILAMGGRPNVDGEPIQGSLSDYIGMMTGMLKPRQLILGHHDNWIPPLTRDNSTEQALLPVRQRVEQTSPGTHLIQLSYLDSTKLLD